MYHCKKLTLIACAYVALTQYAMAGSDELLSDQKTINENFEQVSTQTGERQKGDNWDLSQEDPKPDYPEEPTTTQDACGCIPVSVVGDATYCVTGPICAGSGPTPAGISCPKHQEYAIEGCKENLPSSRNGNCQAPNDATCRRMNGTWMCVYSDTKPQVLEDAPTQAQPAVQSPTLENQPAEKVPEDIFTKDDHTVDQPKKELGKDASFSNDL